MTIVSKHFWLLRCTWLAMLIIPNVWGAEKLLAGKAFTDPSQQTEMSKEWRKQPIQYKSWAKGADLAITLEPQLYPALLPIIQQYAREKQLDIAVQEGTCGTSAMGLKEKTVDIASFCCPPSDADRLPGIKFHTLGIVAIALLVNSANPISNVSLEQARQIFQGTLFRWSEIEANQRGQKRVIHIFGRLHCKQRPGHWRLLLDNEDLFSPRMSEVGTIPNMIFEIASDPYAIGYETLWMLKRYHQRGKVKTLSISHIDPTDNAKLIAGAYPLYRTFNVTTWDLAPTKKSQAEALIKYLTEYLERLGPKYPIVPASKLKRAGWKFLEKELIGESR